MIAKSKITRIFIFEVYWLSTKSSKFFILENKSPYGIYALEYLPSIGLIIVCNGTDEVRGMPFVVPESSDKIFEQLVMLCG